MSRFGEWRPLAANWASQARMTPDIISLHTMVGSLAGVDAMWRKTGYSGSHSHFGVGGSGECWQWQDTAYRAAANYNGNWHIISVETADVGAPFPAWNTSDGSAVPGWTVAQCETLAQLIAAMCKAHNIPCVLIPDAKPGRRGIGYHRQGVPGYMVAGAEQWSTAQGKDCPGNRRIAQIPGIVARAQQLLSGSSPASLPLEDFLSGLSDTEQRALYNRVMGFLRQRWFVVENGQIREVPEGTAGALPASALDTLDGNWLTQIITGGTQTVMGEVSSAFHQEADRDAANQAALSTQLETVGSGDPEQLAKALKSALGEQLAADVAARLTISTS